MTVPAVRLELRLAAANAAPSQVLHLVAGDLAPTLNFELQNADGTPLQLSGTEQVTFRLRARDGVTCVVETHCMFDEESGLWMYQPEAAFTAVAGEFYGELRLADEVEDEESASPYCTSELFTVRIRSAV